MNRALFAACLALACAAPLAGTALAQADTPREEQTFDYVPRSGETVPTLQKPLAETTFEDAEIINHPVYGTIILSKSRWKNWVARALYLTLINITLIVVILSFSKTEEYNIIIAYTLCGASFTVSLWIFLCAVLLQQLGSYAWTYVVPAALVTWAVDYLVLMKIKKYDISLSELKESYKKLRAASHEDPRLASVDGSPGDWPEEDFIVRR